jgi:hypothetical protein
MESSRAHITAFGVGYIAGVAEAAGFGIRIYDHGNPEAVRLEVIDSVGACLARYSVLDMGASVSVWAQWEASGWKYNKLIVKAAEEVSRLWWRLDNNVRPTFTQADYAPALPYRP